MENIEEKKGLSGFHLKIIGLILMTLDHIHYFIASAGVDIPIYFTWLGRIVAPIFVFITVEGFVHTKSRFKYGLRLYLASVIMNILNFKVGDLFSGLGQAMPIINSMFASLFLLVVYLSFAELIIRGFKNKDYKKIILGFILGLLPIVINLLILNKMGNLSLRTLRLIMNFIPMVFFSEGGGFFIILGLIFYLTRNKKILMIVLYSLICILFLRRTGFRLEVMLFENFQWMMIFALPLILLYNGRPGRKVKYLFYIYYPLHVYILYIGGRFIEKSLL